MRLTYFVSHPIQYQAPLLQRIAEQADIDFRVIFETSPPAGRQYEPAFGTTIQWDIPLREGYDNTDLADTELTSEIRSADVVWLHGWQTRTLRRAIRFAHRFHKPVLMRGENCDIAMPDGSGLRGLVKRAYLNRIFRCCSAFLTIGSANAEYYRNHGVPDDKLFFTPYAIDNERFGSAAAAARESRITRKKEMGLGSEQPIILFVGKLERRKRAELLAEAYSRANFGNLDPALVFVGEGEVEPALRTLVPGAVFLGFRNQSELPALYGMADVVVLPSEREPWGLVINEAMACATAVVASDQVGCARDLVTGDCGIVFPSGDAGALAAALERCLAHSEPMGRAAQEAVRRWSYDEDIRGLKQALDYVVRHG